jgi:hypothetical protein
MLDRTRSILDPPRRKPPSGYEEYNINWDSLTDTEVAIAVWFAAALREVRQQEVELFWLAICGHRATAAELRATYDDEHDDGTDN